ncbi:MAG: dihydropteroate synthase [Desulfobacterales bacterium]|nr:dihydropteroate synthase [Desulfobacterales bacterium]
MRPYTLKWDGHRLELGVKTCVMGILNTTPDSFSDGGHFFSLDDALSQGEKLVAAGADILDIGGESTRPFSEGVPEEEELRRVIPVIETLAPRMPVPISIDTTKAAVAKRAVAAGAAIINDVSSLRQDPEMADVAAACGVPVILMHMLGTPRTMQVEPAYEDLFGEIRSFLETAINSAVDRGINRGLLIADPGVGFGKTVEHNLLLVNHLDAFDALDVPLLIGPSRKAFIRTILKGDSGREVTPDLPEVATGTQATVAAAVLSGAHIVRVHDVAATRTTVTLIDAIRQAGQGL